MNLWEGTRRLALLFGLVGAVLGGLGSYLQVQAVLRQRAEHLRFERLADSQEVRHQRVNTEKDLQELRNPTIADPSGWESPVDAGGIKTITWGRDYAVASIQTQDGRTLYPTPAPGAWSYFVIAILPVLGFFIPWGAVRAIGWVVAGFVQPR